VWRCFVVAYMPEGLRWARDQSDTRADSILFGCVLACLEQTPLCNRIFTRHRLERFILPGSLLVLLLTFVVRNEIFRETLRYTLQGLAIAPLLYYAVHMPDSALGRLLNNQWLGRLGILSYSLYLLHATILLEMNRLLPSRFLAACTAFLVAVMLAQLTHVFIEKPTERLRKQFRRTEGASRPTSVERPSLLSVHSEANG
jgi:peptidoglycan/LPS O-acetylase OafA/YrhL